MPLVLVSLASEPPQTTLTSPRISKKIPERQVVREEKLNEVELKPVATKTGGFGKIFRRKGNSSSSSQSATPARSDSAAGFSSTTAAASGHAEYDEYEDDDLPPRVEHQESGWRVLRRPLLR